MDTIKITSISADETIGIASIEENEVIKFDTLTDAIIERGFSPIIKNKTWWVYDIETKDFVDTNVPVTSKGEKGDPYVMTEEDFQRLSAMVKSGVAPYIQNDYWYEYDETAKAFVNTGVLAKGTKGDNGADGYTPIKGVDYTDGKDGKDGKTPIKGVDYFDGKDGYTPIKGVDYFDGNKGEKGDDGYTPIKGIDYFDGEKGEKGDDGRTPVKGVDYFDGEKGEKGDDGNPGNGISSAVLNSNYTLTLNFTDGSSYTTPSIRGAEGPQGKPGTIDDSTKAQIINDVKAQITIPTKTSDLVNDSNFVTSSAIPTDEHINQLIDEALGVVENGYY